MTTSNVVPIRCEQNRCEDCLLSEGCLGHVEDDGLDMPAGQFVMTRIYQRDEHLFRAGSKFESVFIVRSGAVKTYLNGVNGDEQVVGFHFPGDVVGFDAIDRNVHPTYAQALDTASVCVIPYDRLSDLSMRSFVTHRRLMNCMSETIRRNENLMLLLGQKTAGQRVATLLLDIAKYQKRHGLSDCTLHLPMSRIDIGSYLGMAVETVSRVLTRLQNAHAISVRRTEVKITDPAYLHSLVDESGPEPELSAQRAH